MERLIGRYFSSYRIKSIIGSGGMGTVFLAHEEELDRQVAVKVLSPALARDSVFIERFSREAKFLASITHPNLIHVYSIGRTDDGYHYMAMEFLSGIPLDAHIRGHAPLDLGAAFSVVGPVLNALWAIHRAGLVHRDVKPANIMLCNDGRIVLMDFGLAKASDTPGLTRDGIISGTPEYMSPEQAQGQELDNRSDLYSLGVTLFEMLTGSVPYKGPSALTILRKHCEEPIPDVTELNSSIPPQLAAVINRALTKDRDKRFSDASEMAAMLASISPTSDTEILASRTKKSQLPVTRIFNSDPGLKIAPEKAAIQPNRTMYILFALLLGLLLVVAYFVIKGSTGDPGVTSSPPKLSAVVLVPPNYVEFEGRKFIGNPICQITINGAAPEFGRLIEVTEEGKFIYNPLGTELIREIDLNSSIVEIVLPSQDELKKLNIPVE